MVFLTAEPIGDPLNDSVNLPYHYYLACQAKADSRIFEPPDFIEQEEVIFAILLRLGFPADGAEARDPRGA